MEIMFMTKYIKEALTCQARIVGGTAMPQRPKTGRWGNESDATTAIRC
jgi:hypothetical protein